MSDLPISQLLPGRLLHAALKADVIDYLRCSPLPAARRRRLYRGWCTYTMSSCRREELDLVATRRPHERQGELFGPFTAE